jgi:hypothetical protein
MKNFWLDKKKKTHILLRAAYGQHMRNYWLDKKNVEINITDIGIPSAITCNVIVTSPKRLGEA